MSDEASILALFRTVDETFGPVTTLVNNAGGPGPSCKLDDITGEILDQVLAVNVRAPFLLIREAAARMATASAGILLLEVGLEEGLIFRRERRLLSASAWLARVIARRTALGPAPLSAPVRIPAFVRRLGAGYQRAEHEHGQREGAERASVDHGCAP